MPVADAVQAVTIGRHRRAVTEMLAVGREPQPDLLDEAGAGPADRVLLVRAGADLLGSAIRHGCRGATAVAAPPRHPEPADLVVAPGIGTAEEAEAVAATADRALGRGPRASRPASRLWLRPHPRSARGGRGIAPPLPSRTGPLKARPMPDVLTSLRGSVPALVTPFRPDTLDVDLDALARLAERAVERGSAAVVVCGSTGEAPALSAQEHARCVRAASGAAMRRVPVIAGVGALSTDVAVTLAEAAARCGADALLVSAPPYVRPGQEGLRAHVRAVAAGSGLPIMLYDVPSRAGVSFADHTIALLREDGCIAALKDATADLARPARLRRLLGDAFPQFTGDDATAVAHLGMGGAGCVSVVANVVPALSADLHAAWARRDLDRVALLRDALAPLAEALFTETNPVTAKAALDLLGHCASAPRLPLTPATRDTRAALGPLLAALSPAEREAARARLPAALACLPASGPVLAVPGSPA